jgi:large conductance mechanosensitive channel
MNQEYWKLRWVQYAKKITAAKGDALLGKASYMENIPKFHTFWGQHISYHTLNSVTMLKEFKEFAMKGNMLDMAVGIIIGAAFGTIIKSLVDDILMPLISTLTGAPDFSNVYSILADEAGAYTDGMSLAAFREAGGVALAYGPFINAVIAFLLVALALFFVVKGMNKMKKKEEAAPAAPPAPSAEETLLTEIRDLLKAQNS